jgi:hypothetical protein
MLTHPSPEQRRAPRPQSLKQEYEEFIFQRIEEFKDQLPREQLLALADEAVREMEAEAADQLLLTEMMMLEHVDRLIVRRLRLPSYRRWRERYRKLRVSQREPPHWGLATDVPLADLAAELDNADLALVLGSGAAAAALFLAALDVAVLFMDHDLAAIEAAEARAAAEAVASRFQALVVDHEGGWFPDAAPRLVVIDAATMAGFDTGTRGALLDVLKERTPAGGVHCVLPAESQAGVIPLAPDALQSYYAGWHIERGRKSNPRARWFLATKP